MYTMPISINLSKRRLTVRGKVKTLPNKCWLVLQLLIEYSNRTVTRQELIDQIWHGNIYSGQKALTQTIWLLREALGDNAAEARFIRTHPGEGYQWVMAHSLNQPRRWWHIRPIRLKPALPLRQVFTPTGGLLATVTLVVMAGLLWGGSAVQQLESINTTRYPVTSDGSYAYQQGDRVIVELANGQRAIIQPTYGKSFSNPELSADGQQLALQVTESGRCTLVVVEFATRKSKEFTGCFQGLM